MKTQSFTVYGVPEPQGSARGFLVKGKVRITSANKKLGFWRDQIAKQAREVAREGPRPGPIWVMADFFLPRPKRVKKPTRHTTRPDLDKLVRALLDGMTHVFYADDAQVCCINATKSYAMDDQPKVLIVLKWDEET